MILTSIKQLDINKATGSHGIQVRLLKETADQIAPSLTMLFDKSLQLGIFPEDWKLAHIVPIFKKGKRDFVERALRSGGSTGSHIPPLQPRTAWLFSR